MKGMAPLLCCSLVLRGLKSCTLLRAAAFLLSCLAIARLKRADWTLLDDYHLVVKAGK